MYCEICGDPLGMLINGAAICDDCDLSLDHFIAELPTVIEVEFVPPEIVNIPVLVLD